MSIAESPELSEPKPRRGLWLSACAAFGPLLWFAVQQVLYVLSARDCPPFALAISWSVLGSSMLACALAIALLLRRAKTLAAESALPEPEHGRTRLMVFGGLMLNALTLLLLAGFGFPLLLLRPCE